MHPNDYSHHRNSFYKYMSADTGKKILESCSLRWSSPILFNDPFDVPRELAYGVSSKDIYAALSKKFLSLIDNPPNDTSQLDSSFKSIIDLINNSTSSEQKKKLLNTLRNEPDAYQPNEDLLSELQEHWRDQIPDFRILCLTESPEHEAMWLHYVNNYSGIAIELDCNEELDSAWLLAKPVVYQNSKADLSTAEGWADIMCLSHQAAIKRIFDLATYTKSLDWSYEKEWRITNSKRLEDIDNYSDYHFHPKELTRIYLGPLIKQSDKNDIILAAKRYPNIHITQVKIGMGSKFLFRDLNL